MKAENNNSRRILYVSEKAGFFGGVERYIFDTAGALKEAGRHVSIMFREKAFDTDAFLMPFEQSFNFSEVDAVIAEEDFDLVFILKLNDASLVSKMRLAFNTAVCVSDHDYYCMRRHKYFPVGRINCPLPYNMLYCSVCSLGHCRIREFSTLFKEIRKCRAFVVLSEFMRRNLLSNNFPAASIHKIYPVCRVNEKQARKPVFSKPPVIMFAGQLIRGKGVDLFLRALARIEYDCHALLAGDGKDMEFLRNMAAGLGISEKVEFTGRRDDISGLWDRADIAVFPSRWQEPFGLAGIEAFAHKVPVVAFDVGGVAEWLHDRENGLAAPSKNVAALSIELQYLLQNPESAAEMGEAGYNFVTENFTPEKFVSAMDALLKKTRRDNV